MSKRTLVVAHEGCEATPPHSIESVLAGFAAGADMVEIDLRATRDGVIVLRHDEGLLVDGRPVELRAMAYSEIVELERAGRLEPGGAGRITRLEEILEIARERSGALNLDAKEDAIIDPAARCVRSMGMEQLVVVSGSDERRARLVRRRHPYLPVLLDVSEPEYSASGGQPQRFVSSICAAAIGAGCAGLNVDYRFCTEELVAFAASRYLPVSVWTVDERADQERILRQGVDSITTHRVRALRALIDRATTTPDAQRGG